MGRLIDADKLLEETRKDRDYARKNGFMDMYYERQVLIDRIEAQPTAYNVDKVVEKLEKIRVKETCKKEKCDTKEICRICVVDDAIEIVKQVGVSDDVCEAKQGKWIFDKFTAKYGNPYRCSCCSEEFGDTYNYCPNCGVSMKEVE